MQQQWCLKLLCIFGRRLISRTVAAMARICCACLTTSSVVVVVLVLAYTVKFLLPPYFRKISDCGISNDYDDDIVRSEYIAREVMQKNNYCFCRQHFCLSKCYQQGMGYSIENETTPTVVQINVSYFHPLQLPVYDAVSKIETNQSGFKIVYGDPCPHNRFPLDPSDPRDHFKILNDGRVHVPKQDLAFFDLPGYCLESLDGTLTVFLCFVSDSREVITDYKVYPIGMIISSLMLLITVVVYSVIHKLRNLHGNCIVSYCSSLFLSYVSLSVVQTMGVISDETHWYCFVLAFIIQFSFLASFFWLNIMCFDIWWVFSGLRPLRGSVKEREHKKFIIYSIYAWGCPLIIFVITLVMQTVQSIPDSFVKPEFGVDKCWFRSPMATFLYFYLPIIILVVLNIIMFITTAFRLRAHTKETEVLKNGESRRHDENERQRFNLYLKLFIVMGVNWVMELVSWLAGGPKYLWYVTDITNTLQGVLIFLIFVWKRRILRLLNTKLCPSLNLVPTTTSSTRSKVSPSRTTSTSLKQTSSHNMNPAPDSITLKKMQTSDDSDTPA